MNFYKKTVGLILILLPSLSFAQVGIYVNHNNIDRQTVLDTGINHDYALFQSDLKNYSNTSPTGEYVNTTTDQTGILGNKTFTNNITATKLYSQELILATQSGSRTNYSHFTTIGFTNYSSDAPPSPGGYTASFFLTNTGLLTFQDYFTFRASGVDKVKIGGYGSGNGIPLVSYGASASVDPANNNNGIFTYPDHIEKRSGFNASATGGQIAYALFHGDAYGNAIWTNMIITSDGKHIQKSPGGTWFYTHPSDSGAYVADQVTVVIDSYGNATITY